MFLMYRVKHLVLHVTLYSNSSFKWMPLFISRELGTEIGVQWSWHIPFLMYDGSSWKNDLIMNAYNFKLLIGHNISPDNFPYLFLEGRFCISITDNYRVFQTICVLVLVQIIRKTMVEQRASLVVVCWLCIRGLQLSAWPPKFDRHLFCSICAFHLTVMVLSCLIGIFCAKAVI